MNNSCDKVEERRLDRPLCTSPGVAWLLYLVASDSEVAIGIFSLPCVARQVDLAFHGFAPKL